MRANRLGYTTFAVDDLEVAAIRSLARRRGRVLEHDSLSVLGLGAALRLRLPRGMADPADVARTATELGGIAPVRSTGRASPKPANRALPLAIGALPFDRHSPALLTVPRFTVTSRPGEEAQCVVVAERGSVAEAASELHALLRPPRGSPRRRGPDGFRLESVRPHLDFCERVRAAVAEVRAGRLEKVVLVREVLVEANRSFLVEDVVSRLRALYPSCATFSIDGLVGASPELLLERRGDQVRSRPLAGTIARSGDAETDARLSAELLASQKDRTEHRVVVETIAAALAAVCSEVRADDTPSIVALRNVAHLGSVVSGRLSGPPAPGALELVALIHPTPAVAGTPLKAALDYLAKAEGLDRGRFAGPAGYVRADGDGEWFVGIRSAIVEGASARLLAGVGIVADSDPETELAETQLKLQALLSAAVRP